MQASSHLYSGDGDIAWRQTSVNKLGLLQGQITICSQDVVSYFNASLHI